MPVPGRLTTTSATASRLPATRARAATRLLRATRRVSKGGKDVVHELKAEGDQSMGRYIYSYKRGVLVRRHGVRIKAAASSASTSLDTGAHSSGVVGVTWGG